MLTNGWKIRLCDIEISRMDGRTILKAGDMTEKGLLLLLIARLIDLDDKVDSTWVKRVRNDVLCAK